MLYKYNTTCIALVKAWCIKGDKTQHISLKFSYTNKLQKDDDLDFKQIHSSDNSTYLYTKAFPTLTIEKHV